MTDKAEGLVLGICIGGFFGFLFTFVAYNESKDWRIEAGERGYIEYCLPNGNLAWVGECTK